MKDQTYMSIAHMIAKESKCVSYQVGAVIVKDGRIIAHGYNGSPTGQKNCCDLHSSQVRPDMWANGYLTSTGRSEHHHWSNVNEIHAELNAILFAARNGISIDGTTMYVTLTPCIHCAKSLVQSGIKQIIYDKFYDKNQDGWDDILQNGGIEIKQIDWSIK